MAHFAELDNNNIVTRVIVIDNDVTHDENNVEQEELGIAYCKSLFGQETNWVQTSYNNTIRKHYAGVGYTFDSVNNRFVPPQEFASWTLNNETIQWEPPTPYPSDPTDPESEIYVWDEDVTNWILLKDYHIKYPTN